MEEKKISKQEWHIGRLILFLLIIVGMIFRCFSAAVPVGAEITGDDAFENLDWKVVYQEDIVNDTGVVQSVCATDKYIITIENTADSADTPDTVSAYYRYDHDEDGNPVEQYSLAKRVQDREWEHGNGMAYNPNTNEIYVALYTNLVEGNEGSLYVMDPDTLEYKRTIHVDEGYNILGIDYDQDNDRYIIQTDSSDSYSIKILDSDFEVTEDLGPVPTTPGINYQDLCVCGDYVLISPLSNTSLGDNTDYINVYSLSRKEVIMTEVLTPDVPTGSGTELESICSLGDGEFLIIENVRESSGYRYYQFYETAAPWYFTITTDARHGSVSDGSEKVLRGDDYDITYSAEEGYEAGILTVDGEDVDGQDYPDGYSFKDVQSDHEFFLRCTPTLISATPLKGVNLNGVNIPGLLIIFVLMPLMGITLCTYIVLLKKKRRTRRKEERARRRARRKVIARQKAMAMQEKEAAASAEASAPEKVAAADVKATSETKEIKAAAVAASETKEIKVAAAKVASETKEIKVTAAKAEASAEPAMPEKEKAAKVAKKHKAKSKAKAKVTATETEKAKTTEVKAAAETEKAKTTEVKAAAETEEAKTTEVQATAEIEKTQAAAEAKKADETAVQKETVQVEEPKSRKEKTEPSRLAIMLAAASRGLMSGLTVIGKAILAGLSRLGKAILALAHVLLALAGAKFAAWQQKQQEKKAKKLAHEQHRARLQESRRKRLEAEAAQAKAEEEAALAKAAEEEALAKAKEEAEEEAALARAAEEARARTVETAQHSQSEQTAAGADDLSWLEETLAEIDAMDNPHAKSAKTDSESKSEKAPGKERKLPAFGHKSKAERNLWRKADVEEKAEKGVDTVSEESADYRRRTASAEGAEHRRRATSAESAGSRRRVTSAESAEGRRRVTSAESAEGRRRAASAESAGSRRRAASAESAENRRRVASAESAEGRRKAVSAEKADYRRRNESADLRRRTDVAERSNRQRSADSRNQSGNYNAGWPELHNTGRSGKRNTDRD